MRYTKVKVAKFIDRPNRFIAHVEVDGNIETVHVKNTGRCKEILKPGVTVILDEPDNPNRKTKYDLIAVYKEGLGLINIDSQAPNKVAADMLRTKDFAYIKPEFTYGNSRIDFYMEDKEGNKYLMEVKGCTLEYDKVGYFPDAPTERGVKHLKELIKATGDGYRCALAYVIQMEGIDEVRPESNIHKEYADTFEQAKAAGVKIIYIKCKVREEALEYLSDDLSIEMW